MRKQLACLFLCVVVVAVLPSVASAPPGEAMLSQQGTPLSTRWLSASGGSSCEGACDAAEIFVTCSGASAQQCCNSLQGRCQHFSGVCAGDAEILCQF